MIKRFVIPDIHGCSNSLAVLLNNLCSIRTGDEIYFLGDYIIRGPSSHKVLDLLISIKEQGINVFLCRGNHDNDLINANLNFSDSNLKNHIINIVECPALRGKDNRLKQKYTDLLLSTKFAIEIDDFYFVHAGINFSNKEPLKQDKELCETILPDSNYININKVTICGHEIRPLKTIKEELKNRKNIIRLDNGCVYTRYKNLFDVSEYGNLLALNLDNYELLIQKNIDF